MKPSSDPHLITLFDGLSSIYFLVLRKSDRSDMRSEVAISLIKLSGFLEY